MMKTDEMSPPPLGRPLFLLGSGRCGSTRLYEILREHPEVGLTNEARVIDFLRFTSELAGVAVDEVRELHLEERHRLRGVVRPDYTDLFQSVVTDHAPAILQDFYRRSFPGRALRYFGDKLPTAEAAAAAVQAMPETRLVAVIRDPRDYVCSVRAYVAQPAIRERHPYLECSLEESCLHWRNVYDGIARSLTGTYLLRYEDLVAEPRATIEGVLEHLELDLTPGVESALAGQGDFERHGTSLSPGSSVGRYREELTAAEQETVERLCRERMDLHGYR